MLLKGDASFVWYGSYSVLGLGLIFILSHGLRIHHVHSYSLLYMVISIRKFRTVVTIVHLSTVPCMHQWNPAWFLVPYIHSIYEAHIDCTKLNLRRLALGRSAPGVGPRPFLCAAWERAPEAGPPYFFFLFLFIFSMIFQHICVYVILQSCMKEVWRKVVYVPKFMWIILQEKLYIQVILSYMPKLYMSEKLCSFKKKLWKLTPSQSCMQKLFIKVPQVMF